MHHLLRITKTWNSWLIPHYPHKRHTFIWRAFCLNMNRSRAAWIVLKGASESLDGKLSLPKVCAAARSPSLTCDSCKWRVSVHYTDDGRKRSGQTEEIHCWHYNAKYNSVFRIIWPGTSTTCVSWLCLWRLPSTSSCSSIRLMFLFAL